MIRILFVLLLAFVCLYVGIVYESIAVVLLGFALFICIILAVADLIIRYCAIQGNVEMPIGVADPGQDISIQIRINNGCPLAIAKMRYEIVTRNLFVNGDYRAKVYGDCITPGSNLLQFTMVPAEPGNYEVELKRVRIYNMTGTFYVTKKIKRSAFVQVNAQIESVSVALTEATRNYFGDSDSYNDLRPGNDPSETFQIREFRPGDKLQKIHWKLSAKIDDLVVKEDSEPKACPVVLFLDYTRPKDSKTDKVDAYLGVYASISFSLLDAGCAHYVSWYSYARKDIVRVRVHDEESLFFTYSAYLSDRYEGAPDTLTVLYAQKFRGEQYMYAYEWNEKLELTKNGKLEYVFDEKNWKSQLTELEIIL